MYERFYGLKAKPFQLHPDPGFFFPSSGHRRAHAYLQYGVYQREGFIVLTGDVGAGKTTLIRNMMKHLDPTRFVAAQLVSTQLGPSDLIQTIGNAFGLNVRDQSKARVLHELELFFASLLKRGQHALLIVDEAQNLPLKAVEELRMLSNLQYQERAVLQSCLVGQPELRNMMNSPEMRQLRQRVIVSYHLSPLDPDETKAYIEHRLKLVGWSGIPSFASQVFERIHQFCGGVPRRINVVCDRLLLSGYLADKRAFDVPDIDQVISELYQEQAPAAQFGHKASEAAPDANPQSRDGVVIEAADIQRLERRIARIEKALTGVVTLLQEIVKQRHTDEPLKKEG